MESTNAFDSPKQKRLSLESLQGSHLPRLDWRALFEIKGEELSATDIKSMDDYFRQFLSPGTCIKCGARQGGKDIVDAFLGGSKFTWGIANGEGFCETCGYPARAYHRNVGPIKFLNIILQYHPDELSRKAPSVEQEGNEVR